MLRFVCDYCQNVKQPDEVWINGMAAENVGTQAARREVLIDPVWRYERAVQPFAVHFCSVECKDRYLEKLFQQPPSLLEIEQVEVVPAARIVRAKKKPATAVARKRAANLAKARKR